MPSKIPNSKLQIPNNSSIPKFQCFKQASATTDVFTFWSLGYWKLFGIWSLEFGILRTPEAEYGF